MNIPVLIYSSVIRHSDFQLTTSATYTAKFNTSQGAFTVPQLGGTLTLSGRDSKWHVTDYDLGGTSLVYSTAEIFTWKKVGTKTFLVVYGGKFTPQPLYYPVHDQL